MDHEYFGMEGEFVENGDICVPAHARFFKNHICIDWNVSVPPGMDSQTKLLLLAATFLLVSMLSELGGGGGVESRILKGSRHLAPFPALTVN